MSQSPANLKTFLDIFNLRNTETVVYEVLLASGPMKASDVAKQVSINRTSAYDYLTRLVQAGLVFETLKGELKRFAVQPFEKVRLLIEEKEKGILVAKETLTLLQKASLNPERAISPRLRVFEGRDELRQMMKDMLYYSGVTVLAYWPILNMIELLGSDFMREFHERRVKYDIQLKTIWPHDHAPSFAKYPFLAPNQKQKREIRVAPTGTRFTMGYAIYGHTVRFLSSKKESLGFLIESRETAQMMRSQFDLAWRLSKEIK